MYRSDRDFNYARKVAFNALSYCIEKCFNKKRVTEKAFSELWIKEVQQDNDIIENGWYCPPPMGIAVLSGSTKHPSRINYDSLRNPEFWPQDREINWSEDLFYVYYSPLSIKSNRPGDISVTLYFGKDARIREHFKKTHAVTLEILKGIEGCNSSANLFELYLNLLNEHSLLGCGLSSTDPALTNIGHTLPIINLNGRNSLSDDQRKKLVMHEDLLTVLHLGHLMRMSNLLLNLN